MSAKVAFDCLKRDVKKMDSDAVEIGVGLLCIWWDKCASARCEWQSLIICVDGEGLL